MYCPPEEELTVLLYVAGPLTPTLAVLLLQKGKCDLQKERGDENSRLKHPPVKQRIMPFTFFTFSDCDTRPGYHPNALYTIVGDNSGDQMYSRCNRGYCKHQEDSHCIWIPKNGGG